jgi:porin
MTSSSVFGFDNKSRFVASQVFVLFLLVPGVARSDSEPRDAPGRQLGGPQSVENELKSDRAARELDLYQLPLLTPYFEWKDRFADDTGFSFGIDYTSLGRVATHHLSGADEYAASGLMRFFGSWELFGRGTDTAGSLAYRFGHHRKYTDTTPQNLGSESLGYVGLTDTNFDNKGWNLSNLYWRQSWKAGTLQLIGGYHDIADITEVYALADPLKHFQNLSFLAGAGTMSLPGAGSLGLIAAAWLSENVYLQGGVTDARGDGTDPWDGFETFFSDNDYFTHAELGWTTSRDRVYLDNLHLTVWHVDDKGDKATDDGWGATLSFSLYLQERFLPFVKAGYARDGTSLLEKSVSVGIGYQPRPVGSDMGDLLALGVNWGKPNSTVVGHGLDDQYTIEAFYRWQVTRELAITPNVQYLVEPALNRRDDHIWSIGLRGRLAL